VEIRAEAGIPVDQASDALVVPLSRDDGGTDWTGAEAINAALGGELRRLAEDARFAAKRGETFLVPTLGRLPARRIVLAGLGPRDAVDRPAVEGAVGAALLTARTAGATEVVAAFPAAGLPLSAEPALAAAAEGAELALYRFAKYQAADEGGRREITTLRFVAPDLDETAARRALDRGRTIAAAVSLARDLVNEPASVLTPAAMAERAEAIAGAAGLAVETLGPAELAAMGANAIVAVGAGSAHEPRLIRLRYRPGAEDGGRRSEAGSSSDLRPPTSAPPVVGLVGKCITFDTGGYSIKPYEGMLEMKGDMAGGAAVLGAMSALAALDCPVAVEATICAAENMISGTAFRPGDILTALNGVTIEILSTDAEGRLVLADGLVDTARRGATELIDLATLTGAAVVALGDGTTALFASDDDLAERLLAAAARTGERCWRMPLIEELNDKIKGDVGDVKNSGGRAGGAITAALFLRRFSEGLPWAHLDIAGSARRAKAGPLGPKGATGVGVSTLLSYLTEGGARPSPA